MTTTPCSEIVTWLVLKNHVTASVDQIHEIESIEHENNRPVQDVHNRLVRTIN